MAQGDQDYNGGVAKSNYVYATKDELCTEIRSLRTRNTDLEKVAGWAKLLEVSLHRCDRDGVPIIDAWALSQLRAALAVISKKEKQPNEDDYGPETGGDG